MKKFRFSMHKLMDARKAVERGLEMKLAKKILEVQLAKKALAELQHVRRQEVEQIVLLEKMSGEAWRVASLAGYLQALDSEISRNEKCVEVKERERAKVQVELTSAIRERKVLDNLSDREKQDWAQDLKRMEQKSLDEFASTGFVRRLRAV